MKPIYIALGYFDSAHLGHKSIIERAVALAKNSEATAVVFTFSKGLQNYFGYSNGEVFTLSERKQKYTAFGASDIFEYAVNKTYLNLGKLAFLNYINKRLNIKGYVCGEDYTFGKNALGEVNYLKKYAENHNQSVEILPLKNYENEKISTTKIKELLSLGDIEKANVLLGGSYFITGKVIHGRKVGRLLGFPTINLEVSPEKYKIYNAVYSGRVILNGITYKTIINYGGRPTFNLDKTLIEAHIKDFNGDLYGKEITLYFDKYLREIKTFSGKEDLIKQLKTDIEVIK